MENRYLLIIWHKALFCKDKIINDLKQSFKIEKSFYVDWSKDKYKENLYSLYGSKMLDINAKIRNIGYGNFYIVLFKDEKPKFKEIETIFEKHIINENVLEKKKMYRKWTADNFRIHMSLNKEETIHDLDALFGCNYDSIIHDVKADEIVHRNTIGIDGFNSIDEFEESLKLFGNNYLYKINELKYVIFVNKKEDILHFLKTNSLSNYHYALSIKDKAIDLIVLGVNEGDLPNNFFEKVNKDMINDFSINIESYLKFISNKSNKSDEIKTLFVKYNLNNEFLMPLSHKDSKDSLLQKMKSILKYMYCYIKVMIGG